MSTLFVEPTEPAYTSVKGAATILDCHTDSVRRLIYSKKLPYIRIGRAIRIPISALTPETLAANDGDR